MIGKVGAGKQDKRLVKSTAGRFFGQRGNSLGSKQVGQKQQAN